MSARAAPAAARGPRNWFDRLRAEGIRPLLTDALLDMVGELAAQEEELASEGAAGAPRIDASRSREVLEWILRETTADRIRAIEDRLLGTVLGPPDPAAMAILRDEDDRHTRFLDAPALSRISASDGVAARIGADAIGTSLRRGWVHVAHDAPTLRAGHAWRRLPVGCVVLESAAPQAAPIIGETCIEPDAPSNATEPRLQTPSALQPEEVAAHSTTSLAEVR